MLHVLVFSATVVAIVNGVTLNCEPNLPEDKASLRCTCVNPTNNGVEWRINSVLVTSCSGSVDNSCFPVLSGFSSSVSIDEFYFDINPYSYSNCANYSCKDATTGDEELVTTSIADFSGGTPSVYSEPGEGEDGLIEVTTDCIFRKEETDIVVNWYIVGEDVEQFIPDDTFMTPTICPNASKTCNGERAVILNIGYTHNEKTGRCGNVRVEVYHSAIPSDKLEWTTTYAYCIETIESYTGGTLFAVFGMVFCLFGIGLSVVFIITLFLKNSCPDLVKGLAIASLVLSSIGFVVVIVLAILRCNKIIGPEEGGRPGGNGKSDGCGPGDNGDNEGGTDRTRSRVHAEPNETHVALTNRPMPPMPLRQEHDKKGRGQSANFNDGHPMVGVDIPEKKAGDLGPLPEEQQKKKKNKKKNRTTDDEYD